MTYTSPYISFLVHATGVEKTFSLDHGLNCHNVVHQHKIRDVTEHLASLAHGRMTNESVV